MSRDFKGELWIAPPHTIAKIRILSNYLASWFPIVGQRFRGTDLLVIDGFAGPAIYANGIEGSPVIALRAATKALNHGSWIAGNIHFALIEEREEYFTSLQERTGGFAKDGRIKLHYYNDIFTQGLESVKRDLPTFFVGAAPLFAFVDPFGPTGAHFRSIRAILDSRTSEVLINFDHDGISRIMRAYAVGGVAKDANEQNLNNIFGSTVWKELLHLTGKKLAVRVLNLYKSELRKIPKIEYVFSFEMLDSKDQSSYHLLFASQHHRGLSKMKDAMRSMDQTGEFRFSDARVDQEHLFIFDDPREFSQMIYQHFVGQRVNRDVVLRYILNETPFATLAKPLKPLDVEGLLLTHPVSKRAKGTFPEGKITEIEFIRK